VGVVGASGYAGQELVRLLARHPAADFRLAMDVAAVVEQHGRALSRIWQGEFAVLDLDRLAAETDAVFLAVPDAPAAELAPPLIGAGRRVFDLSGAFRLRDQGLRARWYPASPLLPSGTAYGLTELTRQTLHGARLVACAGCYPTAALLALRPLVEADLLDPQVELVIDAKSGITGAGRTPSDRTHFSECQGNIAAYGVFAHRHAAEIEQELGRAVTFVPQLVPINRGILETIYARLRSGAGQDAVAAAYEAAYADAPFVRLTGEALPETKHVAHTNFCDIGWRIRSDDGRLVLVSCIDNLVKGAAGQAVQNFNVAFGLDERAGLG
jgi:N-acetyl-gamma-glutamyl-phosphate reductase